MLLPLGFAQKPPVWISIIFIGAGLLALIVGKSITITADKAVNNLSIEYKGLIGKKSMNYKFSEIKQVQVHETVQRTEGGRKIILYLDLMLVSGEKINIAKSNRFFKSCNRTLIFHL